MDLTPSSWSEKLFNSGPGGHPQIPSFSEANWMAGHVHSRLHHEHPESLLQVKFSSSQVAIPHDWRLSEVVMGGTPKSSIFIGLSKNHQWGNP
jgi:hypothetical protein